MQITQYFNVYLSVNHSSLYSIRVTVGLIRPCMDHGSGWLSGMSACGPCPAVPQYDVTVHQRRYPSRPFPFLLGMGLFYSREFGNVNERDSQAPRNAFTKWQCLLLNRLVLPCQLNMGVREISCTPVFNCCE